MTTNRECLATDPVKLELLNQGVAEVKDLRSVEELKVLRFELQTFVCKGQYAKGLERILSCFNGHIGQVQPASWVSGFYGSGKSHLVKMLRALWADLPFEDGQRPRGVTKLSPEVADALTELNTQAKRHGGLFAAAGTLSSQSQAGASAHASVRLAILAIVFRACGLPEHVHLARFVLRLRSEGNLESVKAYVEGKGKTWAKELANLWVSPFMAEALHQVAKIGASPKEVSGLLKTTYPERSDISNVEMVELLGETISGSMGLSGDKFPLTLIALDEVQQFIGKNDDRALGIQEVVEELRKAQNGRILVVATGQSAITDTPHLMKLAGRFPQMARVELTDQDVDTVVRTVLLAKKPTALPDIEAVVAKAIGEIDRHLVGTAIAPRQSDRDHYVADYPLLPVRRRFWESVLKHIDYSGTSGQLRNQLRVVHEALRQVADKPIGHVIPADVIFDQLKTQMRMAGVISKDTYEAIEKYHAGNDDEKLKGRLLGLIFLIGRFDRASADNQVRAKPDVLADLLVEDLLSGSPELRKRIGLLLEELRQENQVLFVDEEYRVQTTEGRQWEEIYLKKRSLLTSKPQKLQEERSLLVQAKLVESLGRLNRTHGVTAVNREVIQHWGDTPPKEDGPLPVWFLEGSTRSETEFMALVNGAGSESSTVFVRLRDPGSSFDDLVATVKAADQTLHDRGGDQGSEAARAMMTRKREAEKGIQAKFDEMLASAQVYLGGGVPVAGATLAEQVNEAIASALNRRYRKFSIADVAGWPKVVARAKTGSSDALSLIGHQGEPDKHPVAMEVISSIGAGIKGKDLRAKLEGGIYGWPRDCVDGTLLTLVAAGQVRAAINGAPVTITGIDQSKIGQTDFQMEKAVLSATDKMQVRKLINEFPLPCKAGEEPAVVVEYLRKLKELAASAGGPAPAPAAPAAADLDALLSRPAGSNEQLLAVVQSAKQLATWAPAWREQAAQVASRMLRWHKLTALVETGEQNQLSGMDEIQKQIQAIKDQRALLKDPDLIEPLIARLAKDLAEALTAANNAYRTAFDGAWSQIEVDGQWQKLTPADKNRIPREAGFAGPVELHLGTPDEVLTTAKSVTVPYMRSQLAALPQRVGGVLLEAARVNEPKVQPFKPKGRTITSEAELDVWLHETRDAIAAQLKTGPVRI